jgi:dolichol-phosphate mannosyltransferase
MSAWRFPSGLTRLARFGLVGTTGVVVNSALLALLVEAAHLAPAVGAALATEAAILLNFALNDCWTFRDARPRSSWPRRAGQYNLVALGGLLISIGVLVALTHGLRLHYLPANLAGIGAGTAWNYAANCRITWAMPVLGRPRLPAGSATEVRR